MFENFGDLGMNIKRMVDDFQHLSKSSLNLQSIGNIKFCFSLLVGKETEHGILQNLMVWFIFLFCLLIVLGDMAKFVSNYPEYRKTHGNVTKHVALVSEMSRIVEERKLMVVSQTEQELACTSGQAAAFEVHFRHGKYLYP